MAKKNKQNIEIIEEESENTKKQPNGTLRKTTMTLFLFLVPLLILAYTQDFITKCLLFFYLAVLLKNFISDKMQSEETA
jgi:hypothetical protein